MTRRVVSIQNNQLVIDGVKQPQLYGAEIQYFRLRGGYGPGVSRAAVLGLWNKALARAVEAKMNAVSFYIPWDFHEYEEGKFDFTGSADADGDGKADYPARDLVTFFRLVAEHGIKHVMVRPGPYINAEWGFLGFGAVPEWFHNKYPDSHARSPRGNRTKLFDYHNEDFLRHTELWFKALYEQVLKDKIGPGKPVVFLQLDNETNFQWQSLYHHDYGAPAMGRYRKFLRDTRQELSTVNRLHGRDWESWDAVQPPVAPGNSAEDGDWYRFQDFSVYSYIKKLRKLWQGIGVREPEVLFYLAESYNAVADGLLPNYQYRNTPDTGLMGLSLYPKTFSVASEALFNLPFKVDHDILMADEAGDRYTKARQEWVIGPEVQGGWFPNAKVSPAARQQTYLSAVGQGMKALMIYYFHEGYHWQSDWARRRIEPIYKKLHKGKENDKFWQELQTTVDAELLEGFDVRKVMQEKAPERLLFDTALDENAEPREHFQQLKFLGGRLFEAHGEYLARSVNMFDAVAIVKDSQSHAPGDVALNNIINSCDLSGGLLGYLMNEAIHPRILLSESSPKESFERQKCLFHIDSAQHSDATLLRMQEACRRGQGIVNFLSDALVKKLGIASLLHARASAPRTVQFQPATFYLDKNGKLETRETKGVEKHTLLLSGTIYSYALENALNCEPLLYCKDKVLAYRYKGAHGHVVQVGAALFDGFNSTGYPYINDYGTKILFLRALWQSFGVQPLMSVYPSSRFVSAFMRRDGDVFWITVKTSHEYPQNLNLNISPQLLASLPYESYEVEDLLRGGREMLSAHTLGTAGFSLKLAAQDSLVFIVRPKSHS